MLKYRMYYPDNFPKERETLLIDLFQYLLDNFKATKPPQYYIRAFLRDKKTTGFFPAFWMLNFVYWRHFSKKTKFPDFMKYLVKTAVRSQSGIVPLSVFTSPINSCPFNCIYCTTQDNAPKSYFADEAAVRRAIRNHYDPYKQTLNRLIQFFLSGHPIDKIDMIIQGGTFSFYEKEYREKFVSAIFAALNEDVEKIIVKGIYPKYKLQSLEKEKQINETARSRCVGLTIETRPDYINTDEILFLRRLGVTRVEIGVQSVDDEILKNINRGHDVEAVTKASRLLKESGFKITYHLMPGLPGSDLKKDLDGLRTVFRDPRFLPDSLKLYPTQLTRGSGLIKLHAEQKFKLLTNEELLKLVLVFKRDIVPKYVRIMRNVRDHTKEDLEESTFSSNFRQDMEKYLKIHKVSCPCIRCREIKLTKISGEIEFKLTEYESSEGLEYFIECIDGTDQLLGFVRLRIPVHLLKKEKFFIPEIAGAALIRELHVYGKQIKLGSKGSVQHTGLGKLLLEKAEDIARENDAKKIAVISGIGVREYYKKLGYKLDGEYMIKNLDN